MRRDSSDSKFCLMPVSPLFSACFICLNKNQSKAFSCLARSPKKTKKENVAETISCKRALNPDDFDMEKRLVKRARVEIEPLQVKRQVS